MTWTNTGKPGDVVICEDGHEIADVVEHFGPQGLVLPSAFGNWRRGAAPCIGEAFTPCHVCGKPYIQHRTVAIAKAAADNRGFVPSGLCINLR